MSHPSFNFFCCFLYSCSSDNEIDRQYSLNISNHKFYTIKDKLDIYHCSSVCDLFCTAFSSEKIHMYPFQQRSSRRGSVFHYIFQNRLYYSKDNLLTLPRRFLNFWHSWKKQMVRCTDFPNFLVCIKVL